MPETDPALALRVPDEVTDEAGVQLAVPAAADRHRWAKVVLLTRSVRRR